MIKVNEQMINFSKSDKKFGSGGIRTHASEETGALNQRLRPLGHATA
ncbi:GSCOCG00000885001-RA-CDS, partial [Cotesia congregata]